VTARPEPASGIRLLACLLSLTVLVLLVRELDQEKEQLLRPTTASAVSPPRAAEAARPTVPRPPTMAMAMPRVTAQPTASPAAPSSASGLVTAVDQPPDTTPAQPGRYQFAYSVDGQPAQAAMLQVRRLPADGVVRDEQTWFSQSGESVQDHDWTSDQLLTTSSGPCRWSPADTTLVLPLRRGASWTSRSRCHDDDGSTTTSTTSSTVKGWTKVTIGGRRVATWVVERSVATVVTSKHATARSWSAVSDFFAPGLGLTVVESMRAHYPNADGSEQTLDAVRRLLSVTPS
jgi:hypothetical protein